MNTEQQKRVTEWANKNQAHALGSAYIDVLKSTGGLLLITEDAESESPTMASGLNEAIDKMYGALECLARLILDEINTAH
jgi:hypothetical protein